MDDFEKRLKADADAIDAAVSPELRARIGAALHGVEPIRPVVGKGRSTPVGLWLASSLTGLAAAATLILVQNREGPEPAAPPAETLVQMTVPENPAPDLALVRPVLDIRTADFTGPLEDELVKLKADVEKARESVRQDLDFTF